MSSEGPIARRQHGVISRQQLLDLGLSRHQVERRIETEQLLRVLPGVYALAGAPRTERQNLWAAMLWAGDGATVSHRAAAALWHLEGVVCDRAELWSPRRLRATDVIVHRGRTPARDRGKLEGLYVTSMARTLIDLAAVVDEAALEEAIEDARRRRLVSDRRLREDLARFATAGRAGVAALGRRLRALEGTEPTGSILEVRVLRILRAARLPTPVRQFEVVIDGRRYRIDLAWPEHKVGLECEGYGVHGRRVAFVPDRVRAAALVGAGWRIMPVTWEQTRAPDALTSLVRRVLTEAPS